MPINSVCPECKNSFRLQEGMIGKSMRCPVCQEIFIVQDAGANATSPTSPSTPANPEEKALVPDSVPRTRTDAPPVVSRSGNVRDFVPIILDVRSAAQPPISDPAPQVPPPKKPTEVPRTLKGKPPASTEFPWNRGPRPQTILFSPAAQQPPTPPNAPVASLFPSEEAPKPMPKETTWSPEVAPPAPEEEPLDLAPAQPQPASERVRPPKKKKALALVYAMTAFIVAALASGGYFMVKYINDAPERLFKAANEDYEAKRYDQARNLFEKFVREYPDSRHAPEAKFFADLSSLRHTIGSVQARSDPKPGVTQWNKFLETIQEPGVAPFAEKDRFGIDVWQAGVKLAEDVLAKANDTYSDESPDEAEKWLIEVTGIVANLSRFRPADASEPESIAKDIANLRQKIDSARVTLTKLKRASDILGDGSDEKVAAAEKYAKEQGLDKHPHFKTMLGAKEQEIQAKVVYTREPNPILPTAVPDDGLTSLLFAPRFDRGGRRVIEGTATVFFCLARGVLYALDEADGHVLWATRTGLDTDIMPVRVPATALNPELVLIASNTGHQLGITARSARNGVPLWHQSLAVSCQGPPVVIGPNAYVSLGDRDGTILEITLATGDIVGKITIGRPLGPNLAARPGTGLLYIPSESRAVYVVEVDRQDPDGKRLEPVLLGVMNTGHPSGSLRGMPVFSNPDPREPGPCFLVLGQADGLETMKLRAFPLPAAADGKPDGSASVAELALPGWASFPPYCDGEKLAIVTDKGEFGLYGLALTGNRDLAMFAFSSRSAKPGEQRHSRGQVVLAEEGAFWILAAGELRKLRFGINNADGVRLVPYGDPIPAGEPLHAPQVNANGDTFVVVTHEGMTCRATAVNSITGQVRWRRELGLMAKGDPLRIGDDLLLLDHGGGFYRIDTKPLANKGGAAWLVDERWLVAQPARGFTAATGLLAGPNGTAVAVLAGETEQGPKLLVRKLTGNVIEDRLLPADRGLAGPPVISGNFLILPLADGTLYRQSIANFASEWEPGPSWRADRLPATATCFLAPINDNELFATDGARGIVRWRWPATTKLFETQGRLQLPERSAATPVVVPGSPPRLVVADSKGNLAMWDSEKLAPPMLKAWRTSGKNALPTGSIRDGLRLESEAGKPLISYMVGGQLVWLSPDVDNPNWIGPAPIKAVESRPVRVSGRVLITDRAGVVRAINDKTGQLTGEEFQLVGSHAFAAGAQPVGTWNRPFNLTISIGPSFPRLLFKLPIGAGPILVPLVDGTIVLGELKYR